MFYATLHTKVKTIYFVGYCIFCQIILVLLPFHLIRYKKLMIFLGGKVLTWIQPVLIPWHLSCNIRVAEDLGSIVSLVSGDWLALWRVAVAHHLYRVI